MKLMNYFFPRGNGPLCSFLLATRNRKEMAAQAIDSIYSLAEDKTSMEFILKIDDDDANTIDFYMKLVKMGLPIKAIISPRGVGYKQMHIWVNQMAFMASGDWQMIMNDDILFTDHKWDLLLLNAVIHSKSWPGCKDVCALLCQTIGRPEASEFLFVRSKTIQLLGGWGPNVHSDNWISTVLSFVGSSFLAPLKIKHLSDNTADDVRKDALSVYPFSGRMLNTPEQLQAKADDVKKLLDYIELHRENV